MPKGNPKLGNIRDNVVQHAKRRLQEMKDYPPDPKKPKSFWTKLHGIIYHRNRHESWKTRVEFLHQQYKANALADWPLEVQQLLTELFPADEKKYQLEGKQNENLFKAIVAIKLHLVQAELEAAA